MYENRLSFYFSFSSSVLSSCFFFFSLFLFQQRGWKKTQIQKLKEQKQMIFQCATWRTPLMRRRTPPLAKQPRPKKIAKEERKKKKDIRLGITVADQRGSCPFGDDNTSYTNESSNREIVDHFSFLHHGTGHEVLDYESKMKMNKTIEICSNSYDRFLQQWSAQQLRSQYQWRIHTSRLVRMLQAEHLNIYIFWSGTIQKVAKRIPAMNEIGQPNTTP